MKQLSLFEVVSLNVGSPLTEAMVAAERESGLSRGQIVDAMNDLAAQYGVRLSKGNGRNLSLDTLEKWLNPNDLGRTINLKALVIFCRVVGAISPIAELVRPLGGQVIGEKDAKLLRWAQHYQRAKEARTAMKKIEAELL